MRAACGPCSLTRSVWHYLLRRHVGPFEEASGTNEDAYIEGLVDEPLKSPRELGLA
jgi:hypothetical protein